MKSKLLIGVCGKVLGAWRVSLGLTNKDAALLLGIGRRTLLHYERGDYHGFAKDYHKRRHFILPLKRKYYRKHHQKNLDYDRAYKAVYSTPNRYGLTLTEYEELKRKYPKCGICGGAQRLSVDHNHSNGKVRGRLCIHCNNGLGAFDDDIVTLKVAIAYLKVDTGRLYITDVRSKAYKIEKQKLIILQGSRCKICYRQFDQSDSYNKRAPRVDHNHQTGMTRGALCLSCNLGLGNFKDNKVFLEYAISYLSAECES